MWLGINPSHANMNFKTPRSSCHASLGLRFKQQLGKVTILNPNYKGAQWLNL